jgi:hypothetical protein
MKKKLTVISVTVLSILVSYVIYLSAFSNTNLSAQSQSRSDQQVSRKMLEELRREQRMIEAERNRLRQYEQNLKNFEAELEKRYNEFLKKEKDLKEKEEAFQKRLEARTVDRQMIETYEAIDPEQAAILVKNLYVKDNALATLLMRKIAGKKAGKILEAMIPLDREISTQLAKQTLDFYKPD